MFRKAWRRIWPLLTILAVSGVALGVERGEFAIVNRWAHTLCTSCIGLGR
jgi:hypothetical protein